MRKLTTEEFIEKSRNIHGSKYDYSHVIYKNAITKVEVICPEHGSFNPLPSHHMVGTGCPKCGNKKINRNKRFTQEEFLDRVKDIPNLTFEKAIYKSRRDRVIATCKIHGDYKITVEVLFKGSGCKQCASKKLSNDRMITKEAFIKKAILIHGNLYSYDLVDYKGSFADVKIKCKVHNYFMQTPATHLKGSGCPFCKTSKGEILVHHILQLLNIEYETQKTFSGCKYERPLKFDFYLSDHNMCIEFDGEQHFRSMATHWGGDEGYKKRKIKDAIKNFYCQQNNIPLLRIKYNETKVKQKIKEFLSIN